jgi:hypothetical protein
VADNDADSSTSRSSSISPPQSLSPPLSQSLSLSLPGPMTAAKAKLIQMMMLQKEQDKAASQSASALASSLPMPHPGPPAIPCSDNNNTIVNVNVNDVLAGRGSTISHHPGNIAFREFVGSFKVMYMDKSNKLLFKAHMCAHIVDHVRTLEPPGRFLQKKPHTNNIKVWVEMGDEKARKKAGQALREDATEIRAERGMAQFHPRNKKGALVSAMLSGSGSTGSVCGSTGSVCGSRSVSGNETTTPPVVAVAEKPEEEQDQEQNMLQKLFLAQQQYQQHNHDVAKAGSPYHNNTNDEASMDHQVLTLLQSMQHQQKFQHTNHNNSSRIPLLGMASESRKSNIAAEQQETNFVTPYQYQLQNRYQLAQYMAHQELPMQQRITQNELEQDQKIATHDCLEMEDHQGNADTKTGAETETEITKLKLLNMRKQQLFSQRSLSARSMTRQHYQDQDASRDSAVVIAAAATAVSADLGAASIQNCQGEADPSLFVEEMTPSDEKVSTNTDSTIRGAKHHSLLTHWVNAVQIKKDPSMQRLNLDTGGIIAEDDEDEEEEEDDAGADGKMAHRGVASASAIGRVADSAPNSPRACRPTPAAASASSSARRSSSAVAATGPDTHTNNNNRGPQGKAPRRKSINMRDLVSSINSKEKNEQQQSMNLSLSFGTSALLGGFMDSSNTLNGNKNLNLNMSSMSFGTAAMSSMGTIGSAGTGHGHATSHQTLATSCLLLDNNTSSDSYEFDAGMLSSTGIGNTATGTDDASVIAMMGNSTTTSGSSKSLLMSLGDLSIITNTGTIHSSFSSSSSSAMLSLGGNTKMGGVGDQQNN